MPSRVLRDGTSAMDQMFHLFKLWIIQAMPEITANRIIPPIALFIAAPKNIPAMLDVYKRQALYSEYNHYIEVMLYDRNILRTSDT